MKYLSNLVRNNLAIPVLILVSAYISFRNYDPGTWLSGWDTLHHEFNFQMNLNRDLISGVWRYYQGLGAVAGHSHLSDLPRQFLLITLSLFLPNSFLRYAYIFFTMLVGPLGVYLFVKRGISEIGLQHKSRHIIELSSFLAGLFYLLNLGTLQHFYVPFEMFNTAYAFIPFLYLFGLLFMKSGSRKHFILFLFSMICSLPMAYAATLSYITYSFFGLFILSYYWLHLKYHKKTLLHRMFLLGFSILLVNSYWILPNLYFAVNHGAEVSEAKINYLFSEEAFLNNRKYGRIEDLAILRNFLFGWQYMAEDQTIQGLMSVWNRHLSISNTVYVGYLFFVFVLLGVLSSILKRKKEVQALIPVLLLGTFLLLSSNPPLGFIFDYLRNNIPFFREALRFPFTKVSPTQIFVYAALVGYFLSMIFSLINRKILNVLLTIVLAGALGFYMLPAFNGYFISPAMRIKIPDYYFEMFSWFDNKNSTDRVALFPINTHAGWLYYDWGYQGAGFLQFGIQQPILDRDFDRWNLANEQYYREMVYAVYSKDLRLFEAVLEKYNIKYLVLDENVIDPIQGEDALFYDELEELLKSSRSLRLETSFGTALGKSIFVYGRSTPTYTTSYNILSSSEVTFLDRSSYDTRTHRDEVYLQYGIYVTDAYNPSVYSFESVRDTLSPSTLNLNIPSQRLYDFALKETLLPFKVYYRGVGNNLEVALLPVFSNKVDINTSKILTFPDVFSDPSANVILGFGPDVPPMRVLNRELPNNDFVFGGDIVLNKTVNTKLSVYLVNIDALSPLDLGTITSANTCSLDKSSGSYSLEKTSTGFILSGRNTQPCISLPMRDLGVGNGLVFFSIKGDTSYCTAYRGTCLYELPVIDYDGSPELSLKFFMSSADLDQRVSFDPISYGVFSPVISVPLNLLTYYTNEVSPSFTLGPLTEMVSDIQIQNLLQECSTTIKTNKMEPRVDLDSTSYTRLESLSGNGCVSTNLTSIKSGYSYVLGIRSRNVNGMPIRVCLKDLSTNRCIIDSVLHSGRNFESEYFIVPPFNTSQGYNLTLYNYSIGNLAAINDIVATEWFYFPYDFLKQLSVESASPHKSGFNTLVTNDAFESGWIALCGGDICNARHVLVNNWANGWLFEGRVPDNVKIVFWPQYLEYLGFILLLIPFIATLWLPKQEPAEPSINP